MKKRTLVCFLIFTLCVLYTSIPNTVFGQDTSLAQQVFDKHSETLLREDVKVLLPEVLDGLKKSPLPIPTLIDTAIGMIQAGQGAALQGLAAGQGIELTDEHIALLEDPDVQVVLSDETTTALLSLTGAELEAAIDELAALLLGVGAEPPVVEPPVVEPPVVEPPVVEPPVVEPPVVEPPVVEPPVTEPPVVEPPRMEAPTPEPFQSLEMSRGDSLLGGLSLNTTSGREFVERIIAALGLPPSQADAFVEAVLKQVPNGILPKKQIQQILTSGHQSIAFAREANQLDADNFGNAITPNFADFTYLEQSSKHLTSDSMHVYTRVPSANVGGVMFNLTDGRTFEGMEITSESTIPYTFRLEETLAATNLPAWPSLDTQLFSSVVLHYSNTGPNGSYTPVDMHRNGDTWEVEVPIPTGRGTYYYFGVTLTEPVEFMTLSREKLAEIFQDPNTISLAAILNATTVLEINGWAMPDPRNLQLADRGIIDALFDADVQAAFLSIFGSPRAAAVRAKLLSGQQITLNEVLGIITPKQQRTLQNLLLRNTNRLTQKFEESFDPMLASVFTLPTIRPGTSFWFTHIDNIVDGPNQQLEALVLDADGMPVDQIVETFTVDTSAPEARVHITPGDANTAGYLNSEGVYVATAHNPGNVILNVTGVPKPAYVGQGVGPGEGYLFYQQIGLDAHGVPHTTWMPLTVESTMLSSRIWTSVLERNEDQIVSLLKQNFPQLVSGLDAASILTLAKTTSPEAILALLTPETIQNSANSFFNSLGLRNFNFTEAQAATIHQALGGSIKILDELVPVTFDAPHTVKMVVPQGLYGDYGVRAMGIDMLFNVGAYAEPTRVRIVMPAHDAASITAASIGDRNGDGDTDDPYETGIIFADTTENVNLVGALTKTSGHPIDSIVVQYQDASGVWQDIGAASLMGSEFEIEWDVVDFDALVSASDTVMVRAVATNALGISDPDPMLFSINLDAENYPVDPEILALEANFSSITGRNPDSGAPQGTVTISAYTTAQRTAPEIASIRLSAGGRNWEVTTSTDAGGRKKWSVAVDTRSLPDTITKDNPGARNAALDNRKYTVRAVAIGVDETEWSSNLTARFSVDNVDDVPPVGPTNIVSVADEDGPIEANEDGSYTVGGLIDKYDETLASPIAKFTVQPTAQSATYDSVNLVQTDPDGTETSTQGSSGELEFTVDVGTLENGTYMFHALAVDAAGNIQTDASPKITVHIENHERPAPEIVAITVDPAAETNPDSGAPQGTIVLNGYALGERSSPPITSMRFEVKRRDADDSEWKEVGAAAEGMTVTEEEVQELSQNLDFFTDFLYNAAETAAGGEKTASILPDQTYQKWSASIDTREVELEDTIDAESPAARDVSQDTNPYVVRAIAVSAANDSETASSIGIKSTFSLDNVDDVGPIGPTNIVAVADVVGAIEADADGNYTVGGIVDETVPSPIAIYTVEPTADPRTYASVKIIQVDADGNEIPTDGEVGMLDITTDASVDGVYMLHALAVDEFGNEQTDESPQITVNVLNFRVADVTRLRVTAVDDVVVPRTPPEPIPLRSSLTVGFDVDNGSLDAEELSGSVPGNDMSSESEENPENSFSLKVDVSGLADGVYTPEAVVTKRNGSVSFPLKTINLDNTGPMVEIQTPSEDDTVDSLPTVHVTYHDGEGSGVNGASGSLALARLHPPNEVSVAVDQNSLEKDEEALVYTRTEKLPGGAYRVTVQVADILGNVGEGSAEFAINGTPADTTPPVITEAAPSGVIKGESWVTLSAVVNDAESKVISVKFGINDKPFRSIAPAQIADGRVQTAESFTAGTHTVKVVAVSEGGTREHTWTFTLEVDNVAPAITSITPTGTIRAGIPVISASANDESGVDEMDIVLMDSDGEEVKGDTEDDGEDDVEGITRLDFIPEAPLDEGTYTIEVRATDTIGNSATAKGGFTIDFDTAAPVITMSSPQNEARLTERRPQISISYADAESGVDPDSIRFVLDDQLINLASNQKSASQVVYTPPAELAFGQHTVKLEVSDMAHKEGNVSEKSAGAREANMAVHEFTFFVESEEGPVLASRPINAPNPFKDNTRISFTLTRQSTVSIIIYDMTLRPVRVLVDNEVWDAGEYTGKGAIGWDGTSTAGEDLARGIYFCQIMVADGFEPEYAILKLALTR